MVNVNEGVCAITGSLDEVFIDVFVALKSISDCLYDRLDGNTDDIADLLLEPFLIACQPTPSSQKEFEVVLQKVIIRSAEYLKSSHFWFRRYADDEANKFCIEMDKDAEYFDTMSRMAMEAMAAESDCKDCMIGDEIDMKGVDNVVDLLSKIAEKKSGEE